MSPTGKRAFTMVEVMAAACVLAVGSLFVYRAFFSSLDAHAYYTRFMRISPYADEALASAREALVLRHEMPSPMQGTWTVSNKPVAWQLSLQEITRTTDAREAGRYALYRLALVCRWQEGARHATLERVTNVLQRL
jgi:prepilin-type N-terminal cleavage/methylation domain-containing protein